jgi:DNA topoisomerase IB
MRLFNAMRDNNGLLVLQKGTEGEAEEFFNVSTPLGSLDALLAQAEERLCLAGGFPVLILLGLTPHGLNASSDGEIQIFEQAVGAYQENFFRPNLTTLLRLIQISEFGEVDPEITFAFEPLRALSALELSQKRKTDVDADVELVQAGIIDPLEVRERLAAEPDSPYANLDVEDVPEPPLEAAEPPDGIMPPEQDASLGPDLGTPAGQLAAAVAMPGKAREAASGKRGGQEVQAAASDHVRSQAGGTTRLFARDEAEFREEDHPRDEDGKFAPSGSGSSRAGHSGGQVSGRSRANLKETKVVDGRRVQANGSPLPEHIAKLKIPPAWTDVRYSDDPKADLLAVGKDSKGRVQSVYSEAFGARNAAAKFARIEELRRKFDYIWRQNEEAQQSSNPKIKDSADCLALIMKMGVRPGSEDDTGAKVKAYGATTLEGRHVVETPEGVSLRFIGKKGVSLDLPVEDPGLAAMLIRRAKAAGPNGKLFPATNDKTLLDYTHSLDGGGFKTKDFRTHVGTATAYDLVQGLPKPTTLAEYRKRVMDVARKVSKKLGNTPVIALESYINPAVFAEWRIAA